MMRFGLAVMSAVAFSASATVAGVFVTVMVVAVSAVITLEPLFAAVAKPDADTVLPTMKPSVMNDPAARAYPVVVADNGEANVEGCAGSTTFPPVFVPTCRPLSS